MNAANIAVRLRLHPALSGIEAHRGQIQQVILNLITNADDAMRPVADRPRVLTLRSEMPEPGRIAISVEDSGTGVAADNAARIFDPFFTTKSGGMGMGLAISRSIIESFGGKLWAESNAGGGAIFSFSLPARSQEIQ